HLSVDQADQMGRYDAEHDRRAVKGMVEPIGYFDGVGQPESREVEVVLAPVGHSSGQVGFVDPEADAPKSGSEDDGESGAPASAADDGQVHCGAGLSLRGTLVPLFNPCTRTNQRDSNASPAKACPAALLNAPRR